MKRDEFLQVIKSNIGNFGFHITIVTKGIEPRYAYTIGLSEQFGFGLIFAGGVCYFKNDLFVIFNEIFKVIESKDSISKEVSVGLLGRFSFAAVHPSWTKLMMCGFFDYYKKKDIEIFQIIPDSDHYTLDIPNMSQELSTISEPVWRWLIEKWSHKAPSNSTVVTNIDALFGKTITEITRWENDEWEMFAGSGPDIQKDTIRVVSLGTMIGIDNSLLPSISLEVGRGLWRDNPTSKWNNW